MQAELNLDTIKKTEIEIMASRNSAKKKHLV